MSVPLVDFLPPEHRERRSRRRVWMLRAGLSAALVVGMAFAALHVERKSRFLDGELARIREHYERSRTRIAQVEELDRQKEELARRLGILKEVIVQARGSLVLDAVGSSCPERACLTKVDLRVNAARAAPELDVTIEGRCPDHLDVANLLTALSKKPLLSNVSMVFSEDVDAAGREAAGQEKKFVITAKSPGLLSADLLGGAR
ncbi:MAG: PilN domain-containing protein [Planctomycetes bacterium]|nr:PilN domain-containing protein [Planctomycetota bacterium]